MSCFFPVARRVQHIHGDGFLCDGIFIFFRGAAIKISRKSVASLSFRGYSYKRKIRNNGRDNVDNNDIRDARVVMREERSRVGCNFLTRQEQKASFIGTN